MESKAASAVAIRISTATVYHGASGKRYFTAAGAAKSLAKQKYLAKFGCECETTMDETGDLCLTHRIAEQGYSIYNLPEGKRFRRYVRMIRYLLRKAAKAGA